MAKKPRIAVTPSSGNVFADIGVANPDEELAKAQLASRIRVVADATELRAFSARLPRVSHEHVARYKRQGRA